MAMNREINEQRSENFSRLLKADSLDDVRSLKNDPLAELNDEKCDQSSERPIMADALSERQGSQLIKHEEEKAPKSEKMPSQIGKLTLLDDS